VPGGVGGARRRARECALQILYSQDALGAAGLDAAIADFWRGFDDERDPAVKSFAETLVRGATLHRDEIDAAIQKASKNWRLERMARVDRNILRLATYELKWQPDVPAKVVINEAIEVAKRFGTAESPAFVNGLLDRIAQELGVRA
jgi:N utilization substance protein B